MFQCKLVTDHTNSLYILVFDDDYGEYDAYDFMEITNGRDKGFYICCAGGYMNGVCIGSVKVKGN